MAKKLFQFDENSIRELNRVRDKVDSFRGGGISNSPRSLTLARSRNRINRRQEGRNSIPLKIIGTLGDGRYSIAIGKWNMVVAETGAITVASLFDFPVTANAVGIVIDDIVNATRSLAAGDIVFGNLQPSTSDNGKPIAELATGGGFKNARFDSTGHHIQYSFLADPEEADWIDYIPTEACPGPTLSEFLSF